MPVQVEIILVSVLNITVIMSAICIHKATVSIYSETFTLGSAVLCMHVKLWDNVPSASVLMYHIVIYKSMH